MKYYIVAEVRENHENLLNSKKIYNDYVSRKSMEDLATACCQNGYDCEFLGGMKELISFFKQETINLDNYIFINYNYGYPSQFKRGQSPILFELMNAKYSGSDPLTSLLVNDKAFSKKAICNKINTPRSILVFSKDDIKLLNSDSLCFPVVVKPNSEGSSLGIDDDSFCDNIETAKKKVNQLLTTYNPILVEEYIPGYEVTVWIIGNKNSYRLIQPLIISTNNNFYFENKVFTVHDKANHLRRYSLLSSIFPSSLSNKIIDAAKTVFEELGMRDYGRIDFRIKDNELYFIEANALPIFSMSSEIGEISKLCDIQYSDICQKLIETVNARLMSKAN